MEEMKKKLENDNDGEEVPSPREADLEDEKEAEDQQVYASNIHVIEDEGKDTGGPEQVEESERQPGDLEDMPKSSPPADTEEYDVQQ